MGECSLQFILIAQSDIGLCAVFFGNDKKALRRELAARFPQATLIEGGPRVEKLLSSVIQFMENPSSKTPIVCDERGTPFQRFVWQALREIPAGTTASYADIAQKIGFPKAARAVAQACGANFLAILIPCHRVIRSDGSLSGYHWGIERKRTLLEWESKSSRNPNILM
jgi:AraC family transcriptional regulator of adaptative response/methylated-DNA-[protein]-cysteine methyltransferase